MKIKLDENLPDRLVAVLIGLGHNVDTVRKGLKGRPRFGLWTGKTVFDICRFTARHGRKRDSRKDIDKNG